MGHKIFINLPINDLKKSMAFWQALGFKFNAQFTNDEAASLVFTDDIYAMLHTHESFRRFTQKKIIDATTSTEVILTLSADSKEDLHRLADAAVNAGGKEAHPMEDYGFMIQRAFFDLDGHNWGVIYMDSSYVQPA